MDNPNFTDSLKFTLLWEGGDTYTNDPNDPGAATKFGISQRYHPNVNIKNLTIKQASAIYFQQYWLPSGADKMAWPLCLAVFDSCVNLGPVRTADLFDKMAGRNFSVKDAAIFLCDQRREYYYELVGRNPSKQRFLSGWENRVNALIKVCQQEIT